MRSSDLKSVRNSTPGTVRVIGLMFFLGAPMALLAQTNLVSCQPGSGEEIKCRSVANDGSITVRTYRPNPFGEGYQADSYIQRRVDVRTIGDRPIVDPMPPRPPIPATKIPTTNPQETWKPRREAKPSDGFLN